jgi:hypothetical protein
MTRNKWLMVFLGLFLIPYVISQQAAGTDNIKASVKVSLNCQLFPANNIWNTPIDTLPVDANSSTYINTIGAGKYVHADFGSGLWEGGPIGIPFTTVPGNQEKVDVTFDYDDESDPGPYPIPADAPIEGGSDSDGDRHVLVVDRDHCILYELYYAFPQPDGSWTAGSGAIFDLKSNDLRPAGWTSADAAGLPILPGLVRYEEVAAGEINHALRFTAPQTRKKYIWPARHYASHLTGSQYPPMGQRFRLKANFNISGFSPEVQVILKALKKYGMFLADNGSSWFISGVPDERWDNDDLHELHNVKGSDFEAVDESSLMVDPNSGKALQSGTTKTITVTSPKGGESWGVTTTQSITWTSTGNIQNVKIELFKGGNLASTIVSSTPNDGSKNWTLPGSLAAGSDYQIKIIDTSDETVSDTGGAFTITTPTGSQPVIFLSRDRLNVGAVISGASTGSQTFSVDNSGEGTLNWSITDDAEWLDCSPLSGTNSGVVNVSIDPSGLPLSAGTTIGTITISDPNASNSPQTVTVYLTVKSVSQDQPPFGSFETPVDGSIVRSSIPVTGWALDDIGVESIKIYRQQGGQLVYIGDAILVEGARTDIESAYPGYPFNYKAGWGYMLLTNFLPNGGNGTFKLYAVARDLSGQEKNLGVKTITCDNANAVKPFGAIDTPKQGGTASGSSFRNHGWVLTPLPNQIPTDGSTINVYVDGVYLGHPVYNVYRSDIAALFPGYANSNGAHAYFDFDTTAYTNGVHTIYWTAEDDAGNIDGIGSRYFTIQNSGARAQSSLVIGHWLAVSKKPVGVIKGFKKDSNPKKIYPDKKGNISIKIRELQLLEVRLFPEGAGVLAPLLSAPLLVCSGFHIVGSQLRPLPIGSTLDTKRGIFYWHPGPGFIGNYELVFIVRGEAGKFIKKNITIKIGP